MKIKSYFFALLLVPIVSIAQYDYYHWDNTSLTTLNIRSNSEFVADDSERIYFVHAGDDLIHNYHLNFPWSPVLNANAVRVKAGSHIELVDGAIYYVGVDNKIQRLEWDPAFNKWASFTYPTQAVASGVGFKVNNKNHIFYIRAGSNRVSNFWDNGISQGDNILNTNAPIATSFSNLEFVEDHLYYINSNRKISYLTPTSSTSWSYGSRNTHTILNNSRIHAQNKNHVFYINESNEVGNYYYNGQHNFGLIEYAPLASGSTQFYSTNEELFYVGLDDLTYVLNWNGCRWMEQSLNGESFLSHPKFSISSSIQPNGSLFHIQSNSTLSVLRKPDIQSDFVYKKADRLQMNGEDYAVNGLAYFARLKYDQTNDVWYIGPHFASRPLSTNPNPNPKPGICFNQGDCDMALNEHLTLIKSLGFETIRFTDIEVDLKDNTPGLNIKQPTTYDNYNDTKLYIKYENYPTPNIVSGASEEFKEITPGFENILFNLYDKLLDAAGNHGLKVNFYVGLEHMQRSEKHHDTYLSYVGRFADRFKNRSEISFYTVGFELSAKARITHKGYICQYLEKIYDRIRLYDKNHLVTAGTFNIGGIYDWDPGLFKVDVLTFHLYPSGGAILPNMYTVGDRYLNWFRNIMNEKIRKPWILGETGCVSWIESQVELEEQDKYADYSIKNSFACGASGHVWFNFADLTPSGVGSSIFHGLYPFMSITGKPVLTNDPQPFLFTPTWECNGSCPVSLDYFNVDNSKPYVVTGLVVDKRTGNPIKDAIISGIGSSGSWVSTFSDGNGLFSLTTNETLDRLDISSIGKDVQIKWPGDINYNSSGQANVSEIELSDVICSFDPDVDNIRIRGKKALISMNDNKSLVSLYPNPGQKDVFLTFENYKGALVFIELLNVGGKTIYKQSLGIQDKFVVHKIELDLAAGTYIVKVNGDLNFEEKLIIQ